MTESTWRISTFSGGTGCVSVTVVEEAGRG